MVFFAPRYFRSGKQQKAIALVSIKVQTPEDLAETFPIAGLPADWREVPAPQSTADLGPKWLQDRKNAVLCVPSILAAGEHNYLINPTHPAAAKITTSRPEPYSFDPRMWK
ncbi:MAG: RES family NAD+ phosphorylase [Acidiferrobacterales bacterium]